MTRNSNFILLSFSILETGESVMSAKGNTTTAIVNGSESYETMKEAFGGIFYEINTMINSGELMVENQEVNIDFLSWRRLQVHFVNAWTEGCHMKLCLCLVQGTQQASLEYWGTLF